MRCDEREQINKRARKLPQPRKEVTPDEAFLNIENKPKLCEGKPSFLNLALTAREHIVGHGFWLNDS